MKQKNITYLLGAGASYHSQPILAHLSGKMIELGERYLPKETAYKFDTIYDNPFKPALPDLDYNHFIIWDIAYFGRKAVKFGTIDTYAKMLELNSLDFDLLRLKLALSSFFLIFQNIDDIPYKSGIKGGYEYIDKRYISLLSTILDKKGSKPMLKENIKFITWNYDLQIQLAFQQFTDFLKFRDINHYLKYVPKKQDTLDICHLNGFHGHFGFEGGIMDTPYKYLKGNTIDEILKPYSSNAITNGGIVKIDVDTYINYAWETNNEFSEIIRAQAESIFQNTDILVVIGYSFPTFNKDIDKLLFEKLKGRDVKVYYQDPNATKLQIKHLSGLEEDRIECIKENQDYFFLPYEF